MLSKIKIFITRKLPQNSILVTHLRDADVKIWGCSLIELSSIHFNDFPKSDWIFFYSKNGVRYFFEQLSASQRGQVMNAKIAAMGNGTATSLRSFNQTVDFVGNGSPSTIAEQFLEKLFAHNKVLFVRAKHSVKSIQSLLDGKVQVMDLVVYNNEPKTQLDIGQADVLFFTSPLNVKAYYTNYPVDQKQIVMAIGATTANALYEMGVSQVTVADQPSEMGILNCISTKFSL